VSVRIAHGSATMTLAMTPRGALLLLGGGLIGLTLAALAVHIPGAVDVGTDARKYTFVAMLGIASVVYLLAVQIVLRGPTFRFALPIVLAVAVGVRLVVLFADPFLSSDVYRYVWDGRVQVAGINPYRYIPADPALQSLRDEAIYPNINRAEVSRTPYPPAAQVVFQAVARVSQSVLAMKLAMVAFEALACWAMLRLLALARLPGSRVLIYAWNPGAVWSFAGNGHVDAIAIGVLAVALLLRARRRDTWVGVALGVAVLVKFLPAAVAPALWRPRGQPRGQRWARWRTPLATIAVIVGLYLAYNDDGRYVLDSLIFYFHDENLAQGSGIWLLSGIAEVAELPPSASMIYGACALAILGALAAWVTFRPRPPIGDAADIRRVCADAALLGAALTVVISPHYQWYFAWLALPCCVSPRWSILWLSVASAVLYVPNIEVWFYWPCLVYLPAAALAAREWWQSAARQPLVDVKVTQGSM
jgi:alpha-1,6-mannosyltransferase